MKYNIKEMIKDNKKVHFKFYRAGNLYYQTECGFLFPVPIVDIGDATFNTEEKAILLMRYIRKYLMEIENEK